MSSPRREHVFMVRMWHAGAALADEWRGSIRDVTAGRTYYVVGTREIADFIASALAEGGDPGEQPG